MSDGARDLLEQFRKLGASDQRELCKLLLSELAGAATVASPRRRKAIADVAGKHRPTPNLQAATHDAGFAEAVAASKTGSLLA
jgi:hypothetical protein